MIKKSIITGENVQTVKTPVYKKPWFVVISVLFMIVIARGVFSVLSKPKVEQPSTDLVSIESSTDTVEAKYKEYKIKEATFSVNEEWNFRKEKSDDILYFDPDNDSMLMVSWSELKDYSIVDSTSRSAFIDGLKKSGEVIPVNEQTLQIDGISGYLYDSTGTINGSSYEGQVFFVDTPTGIFIAVYMSSDEYSDQRRQEFSKLIESVNIIGEVNKVTTNTTETPTSSSITEVVSSFNPTDSSDGTIESIKTYDDYLKMYEFIVNEYISNYENALDQFGLTDAETFQSLRDGVSQSLEEQRELYGHLGNAPIVGKSDLVTVLKEYRNQLKALTDALGG